MAVDRTAPRFMWRPLMGMLDAVEAPVDTPDDTPILLLVSPGKKGLDAHGVAPEPLTDGERQVLTECPEPIPLSALPDPLRVSLWGTLGPGFEPALLTQVHPGVMNPFDMRALANLDAASRSTLAAYLDPDFVRRPVAEKAEVLEALGPLLAPGHAERLADVHLPLPFVSSSGRTMTFAFEREAVLLHNPLVLDYYAPDPTGALNPAALEPRTKRVEGFLSSLRELVADGVVLPQFERLSDEAKLDALRWKDLNVAGRLVYLDLIAENVDSNVALYRIDDPKQTPRKETAPPTLAKRLLWEGPPLGVYEVTTEKGGYDTLDVLFADRAFILRMVEAGNGHVHRVVDLPTPDDVKTLGPKLVTHFAYEDLFLMTSAWARGLPTLHHTKLKVHRATQLQRTIDKMRTGSITHFDLCDLKAYGTGIRSSQTYDGDGSLFGGELRNLGAGGELWLQSTVLRSAKILSTGAFEKYEPLPAAWNAGDPSVLTAALDAAKKDGALQKIAEDADIDFATLLNLSTKAAKRGELTEPYQLASPLWAWDALPSVTPEQATDIAEKQKAFTKRLLELARGVSRAKKNNRPIDHGKLRTKIVEAVMQFHAEVRTDQIVEEIFDAALRQDA